MRRLRAGVSANSDTEVQLAQCPVKNSQLHHSMSTISRPNAQPTSTRCSRGEWLGPVTQRPSMIHSGNQSKVARLTEKNQYDIENATTCTPTQLASPQ